MDSESGASEVPSAYAPPRARWYHQFWYAWEAFRRAFRLTKVEEYFGIPLFKLVLGFLVPTYALRLARETFLWRVATIVYFGLLVTLVLGSGFLISRVASGLLAALHAIGFLFFCWRLDRSQSFPERAGYSLVVSLCYWLLIYMPLVGWMHTNWAMPVQLNGQVVIMDPQATFSTVQRGDWIVYRINHGGGNQVYVHGGMASGRVLALAGDTVRLEPGAMQVNGIQQPRPPELPAPREFQVATGQLFVSPEMSIDVRGNIPAHSITDTMFQLAFVSQEQFTGRAFTHWFGRKQKIPQP
jgi:hypothetical protein